MIERIKSLLDSIKDIDGYKIVEKRISSNELFFIRHDLDMNRAKDVHKFTVTVYKDFEENGVKYRGSSTAMIHPSMDDGELKNAISNAAFAAGFVKNQFYPIAKPSCCPGNKTDNEKTVQTLIPGFIDAIFEADTYENGWVNSAELFLDNIYMRVVNSEGVDVSTKGFKGMLEFITDWKGESEDIELYRNLGFADFMPGLVTEKVGEMLNMASEKAKAYPTPHLKKHTVLLTSEPVIEFFMYYYNQSSASAVYNHLSTMKIGDKVQGDGAKGDLIDIKLDPTLPNSSKSALFDEDGFILKTTEIFSDGVLKRYWGDVRHSSYLGIEPTGMIENIVIGGGSKSQEEMKKEPYLELTAFSDFQMDSLTGDFAGEIRLGWYWDGTKKIPVSGGSISGNIKDVQGCMYLSKELQQENNFLGPKTIQLFDVSVTGAK